MISFSNVSPDIAQAMCTPMHLILPAGSSSPSSPTTRNSSRPALSSSHSQSCTQPPGYGALWLGSVSAVLDSSHLREVNIRHLVQVLDVPWLPPLEKEGYETYRMDILDLESENLRPHLEDVVEDIDKALRRGKNVLVHCQQGVSRSAAIVIAFLIRKHNMSYETALAFVKQRRACIKPNAGFVRCLREWEDRWRPAPSRQPSLSSTSPHPPSSPSSPTHRSAQLQLHTQPMTMHQPLQSAPGPHPSQPPIAMNLKLPMSRVRSAAPVRDGRVDIPRKPSLGVRPEMARSQSHQAVASPSRAM